MNLTMMDKLRRLTLLVFCVFLLVMCSSQAVPSTKIDNSSIPAQKAAALALELARTYDTEIDENEIEVYMVGSKYHVFIKKAENVKPPSLLFEVDLRTGECNHIPLM